MAVDHRCELVMISVQEPAPTAHLDFYLRCYDYGRNEFVTEEMKKGIDLCLMMLSLGKIAIDTYKNV